MTDAATWSSDDVAKVLRLPTASDDKYSRGVVGVRTGSQRYPGAAVLGVDAAWRTGVGMVRYIGPKRPTDLVLHRRPETVAAEGRVQAWVLGSGTDPSERDAAETAALRGILDGDAPVVVDAGALDLVAAASAPRVITPHDREHARLRASLDLPEIDDRADAAADTARRLGVTVLLKGGETLVATPSGWTARVVAEVPWLATAGTGDVLAGVLGALVAGAAADAETSDGAMDAEMLGPLAASASWLHGDAARRAAASRGARGGPITALEVAEALPFAVGGVLAAP